MLRYRSKTTEMQKFPIDSYSNENFISPFSAPLPGPLTPKRGEDTSGTRKYGKIWRESARGLSINRCQKTNKKNKKTNKKNYSTTNTSPFALTSEWRVIMRDKQSTANRQRYFRFGSQGLTVRNKVSVQYPATACFFSLRYSNRRQ